LRLQAEAGLALLHSGGAAEPRPENRGVTNPHSEWSSP
jgi:hypothetical protein